MSAAPAAAPGAAPLEPPAVLVLNAGSSSLKAALIGAGGTPLWRDQWSWDVTSAPEQPGSPEAVLQAWLPGLLARWGDGVDLVGHRVVHGGERFTAPTRLDAASVQQLESLVELAPLHNAAALRVIGWLAHQLPQIPQWACFDTAFHRSLAPAAYTYALPAAWRALGLRRYGFHGLNHQHISEEVLRREAAGRDGMAATRRATEVQTDLGTDPCGAPATEVVTDVATDPAAHTCLDSSLNRAAVRTTDPDPDPGPAAGPLRLISCHLGAGCSLCAIRAGVSVATTMGYTPLEGLVMASRSGSVDPGVLLALLRRGITPAELDQALHGASGLLGLSELSGNMQDLRQAAAAGHAGARLAIEVFQARLLQGIGAMAASLGGVDVIALSGGIGEHDRDLQAGLRRELAWLGPFRLYIVPADEEGVIARSCRRAEAQWRRQH
ncbi:MAG: acetate kinase [Synechococcus sp.]|nr:acetate kinase [Synechococcus sp.]